MQNAAQRTEVLRCAQQKLLQLETLTTELLTCPAGQLDELLGRRSALMEELNGLVGSEEPPIPLPGEAASAEDEALLDAAGQCRAAVCRLSQLDKQVVARLQNMQQQVLQKIRMVGRSAGAQAARYYTPQTPQSSFTGSM